MDLFTNRHLHQRISEYVQAQIGMHMKEHGVEKASLPDNFLVLKKWRICRNKFKGLVRLREAIYTRHQTITERAIGIDSSI